MQSDKYALVLSANIIEGEKKDLERRVIDIEKEKGTTDKRVEELEVQNSLLDKQLKAANEKQLDIAPFCNQASLLQKEINQVLLKLAGEMYKIKQIEAILKEIVIRVQEEVIRHGRTCAEPANVDRS